MNTKIKKTGKLSVSEWAELRECERVISEGQKTFVEVGTKLARVRDYKLYREKYGTFAEYCEQKWGWGKRYANQLIEGTAAVKSLPAEVGIIVPNPGAALALARVPESQREAVLESAASTGPVTAKSIKVAADAQVHEVDETGAVILPSIMDDWKRAREIGRTFTQKLSEIKCALEYGLKNRDTVFAEVNNQTVADLTNAYSAVKLIVPFCVCPTCQGRQRSTCRTCSGRGFLSSFYYSTKIDEKTKSLRQKTARK